jgi:hypothetical protein
LKLTHSHEKRLQVKQTRVEYDMKSKQTMLLRLVVVVISTFVCARWYTINSILTRVNITDCNAKVVEEYDLFFEGSYSNFYRSIQNYATSDGYAADIQNFSVQALTDNIQVVSSSIYKPNSKAMRLNVLFSPLKSNIGATKFLFEYTIVNFLSTRDKTNGLTWNTKWKVPVPIFNTTIYFEKTVAPEDIQVEDSSNDAIHKSESTVRSIKYTHHLDHGSAEKSLLWN